MNFVVRWINISTGAVGTLAGSRTPTFRDGTGIGAGFSAVNGVALNGAGTFALVSDLSTIRRIDVSSGVTTTIAGNGTRGYADGSSSSAMFSYPFAVVLDSSGTSALVVSSANTGGLLLF